MSSRYSEFQTEATSLKKTVLNRLELTRTDGLDGLFESVSPTSSSVLSKPGMHWHHRGLNLKPPDCIGSILHLYHGECRWSCL